MTEKIMTLSKPNQSTYLQLVKQTHIPASKNTLTNVLKASQSQTFGKINIGMAYFFYIILGYDKIF